MDDEKELLAKLFPGDDPNPRGKHYAVIYESEGPGTDAAVVVGKHIDPARFGRSGEPYLEIIETSACTEMEEMHTVLRKNYVVQNGELLSRSIVGMRTWEEGLNLHDGFRQLVYDDPFTPQEMVNALSELLAGLAEQRGLEKPQRKILERVHRGLPPSAETGHSR
jgi:hypothetical protein